MVWSCRSKTKAEPDKHTQKQDLWRVIPLPKTKSHLQCPPQLSVAMTTIRCNELRKRDGTFTNTNVVQLLVRWSTSRIVVQNLYMERPKKTRQNNIRQGKANMARCSRTRQGKAKMARRSWTQPTRETKTSENTTKDQKTYKERKVDIDRIQTIHSKEGRMTEH